MTKRFRCASLLALTAAALISAVTTGAAIVPPVPTPPGVPAPPPAPLPFPVGADPAQPQPSAQSAAASTSNAQAATTAAVDATFQRLVAAQINAVRRSYGRSRLTVSSALTRAGREHARELALAGYFSHDWSDGTPFGSWIRRFYPPAGAHRWSAGENLAYAQSVVVAHRGLMQSEGHRANILRPEFTRIGIGVITAGAYGKMFTQMFLTPPP